MEQKIGRKAEVEESRIIEAAMTIIEQGKSVSGWKLRNIIGAGNPGRLMKVWGGPLRRNRWRFANNRSA